MANETLLIDADILIYRVGFGAQSKEEVKPAEMVVTWVDNIINDMKTKLQSDKVECFLTRPGKTNFRYNRATLLPYKGNRTDASRPVLYVDIYNHIITSYKTFEAIDCEADDLMGLRHTEGCDTIICTIDKDLRMLPGKYYNFVEDTLETLDDYGNLQLVNNNRKLIGEGLMWFYAQMLLGDRVDNIPGISGVGVVATHRLLHKCKTEDELFKVVWKQYLRYYRTKKKRIDECAEIMVEIADLLWIQRTGCKSKCDHMYKMLETVL